MIRLHVDFNCREDTRTIAILRPMEIPDEQRKVGELVTLYEPGSIECEANFTARHALGVGCRYTRRNDP